jgi:carbohydrate binding protein with CBMX2 domain
MPQFTAEDRESFRAAARAVNDAQLSVPSSARSYRNAIRASWPGSRTPGKHLVKGTDYIVDGRVVTIKKAYLAARPTGTTWQLDFHYRDDVHSRQPTAR